MRLAIEMAPILRKIILFNSIAILAQVNAQNFVQNGDLEEFTACPDYVSQIDRATGWARPTEGTSDYFNACLGVPFSMSVPDNQFGDQTAHSGNGYAGFYCFSDMAVFDDPDPYREYVTHALSEPLVVGETYSIEFFISLADVSKFGVKHIGALLSVDQPYRNDDHVIEATPQITSNGIDWLNDKDGWTRISGCIVADSAYSYITIGSFATSAETEVIETETEFPLVFFSYYFVDDVSVIAIPSPDLGPDLSACGEAAISVQEPIEGVTYEWNTGGTGISIEVDSTGTYHVLAELDGCITSDTIHVEIMSPIAIEVPADTIHDFCADPQLQLELTDLPTGAAVQWDHGAMGSALITDHPGTFSFTVTAPDHCPFAGSVTIDDSCEHPVFIPNCFTPNGDGINDRFAPVFDPWTTRLRYSIHDRWGSEIFSSEGDPWSGDDLPIGVYELTYLTEHIPSGRRSKGVGHITLLR